MRKTCKKQLPLSKATTAHPKVKELEKISNILDKNLNIYELVTQDLGQADNDTAANGMMSLCSEFNYVVGFRF